MKDEYDIFRLESGVPLWLESAKSTAHAKDRIEKLGKIAPGTYLIFHTLTQTRLEIAVENGSGNSTSLSSAEIELVLSQAMETVSTDLGSLQIYNPQSNGLDLVAHAGFDQEFVQHFRSVPNGHEACGSALSRRQRVIIHNVALDPVFGSESRRILLGNNVLSVQSVPLVNSREELVGMVSTHFRTIEVPQHKLDLLRDDLVTAFADQVTSSLRR